MRSYDATSKLCKAEKPLPSVLIFSLGLLLLFIFRTDLRDVRNLVLNSGVTCVRVEGYQTREGVGALIKRNQIAFFLADRLNANLTFPEVRSKHQYHVDGLFSKCPPTPEGCNINQDDLFLNRCPIGDCDCRFRMLQPYLSQLPSYCSVISFTNNRFRSTEYCGCYRNLIRHYFGGPKLWPRSYDAIHYRQGDLANTTGKAFGKRHLANLMNAMCKLSDRDLIVVTEGEPEVPVCGNRVVLAGNTTMEQALHIMQHAEHITIGRSSFAAVMADVANPQRVFINFGDYDFLRWIKAPKYTVIGRSGQLFHFDDFHVLRRAYDAGLEKRTSGSYYRSESTNMSIPSRRWEAEALLTKV